MLSIYISITLFLFNMYKEGLQAGQCFQVAFRRSSAETALYRIVNFKVPYDVNHHKALRITLDVKYSEGCISNRNRSNFKSIYRVAIYMENLNNLA